MRKFSEFAEPDDIRLAGDKLRMSDILGKEIEITGYRVTKSKIKEGLYVTLQFKLDDDLHIIFTGSKTLRELILKYEYEIPFHTTIEQMGSSYRFT